MTIRHRSMEPRDVRECAEIVANHPAFGPRYGSLIGDLPKAWQRLLGCEAKRATIYQATDGSRAPICFFGVSVFVNDDFVLELKAAPSFWIGPELLKRIARGNSPILSDRQFMEANWRGGLNLLVWEGCIRQEFETKIEIYRHVMSTFIEEHTGFLLNEFIGPQLESAERLRWTLQSGALLWNPVVGRYEGSFKRDPKEIVREPHLVGLTRKIEIDRPDTLAPSWVGALFDYHQPQCGFSRSEQRMLVTALDGGTTDRELAEEMGVSVSTVKKTWLSVYRRMADHLPELDPSHSQPGEPILARGAEKKRYLLAYLRKHPEELRPVARRQSRSEESTRSLGGFVDAPRRVPKSRV